MCGEVPPCNFFTEKEIFRSLPRYDFFWYFSTIDVAIEALVQDKFKLIAHQAIRYFF